MRIHFNSRQSIRLLLTLAIAALACVAVARWWIEADSAGRVHHNAISTPKRKVGLVLGCARNIYFYHRANAASSLYKAGKIEFILVSGDNHVATYDEAGAMKASLIKRGVPEDRIVCDYAGFSTIDSIVRAKKVFGLTQFTVISQEFHVRRAIFIAKRKKIDAIGFCAVDVATRTGFRTRLREHLARVKTILDLYVLHRQPVYLGDPIQIGASNPRFPATTSTNWVASTKPDRILSR